MLQQKKKRKKEKKLRVSAHLIGEFIYMLTDKSLPLKHKTSYKKE